MPEQENETAKAIEFLLSAFTQRIQALTLENLAYQNVLRANKLSPDAEKLRLKASPEHAAWLHKCNELRLRAIREVDRQDFSAVFGTFGTMLGLLDQKLSVH